MAMLYCFAELRQELGVQLRAVHVNHGVRIPDSDLDERFVADESRKLNIPCSIHRLRGFDSASSENDLREARYQIFREVVEKHTHARLATAHHLDDQLETFMMRLARGSSLKGLTGIPLRRGLFIRPFLFLKRSEIDQFVSEKGIPYRQDFSNFDEKKLRNKVRGQLTPALINTFGAEFYDGFAKSLNDLCAMHDFFESDSKRLFVEIVRQDGEDLTLNEDLYKILPARQRQRLLEYCISTFQPLNFGVPEKHRQLFDSFVSMAATGSYFSLKKDVRAVRERKGVRIYRQVLSSNETQELSPGQIVSIGRNEIGMKEVLSSEIKFDRNSQREYVCGQRFNFPLKVRNWQAGDFFYPLGLGLSQKLSDFFINQKIERAQKQNIPIVLNGDEIVWVAGYRLDDRYRVEAGCKTIYQLYIQTRQEES